MNKSKFKALRSEFRNCERMAFRQSRCSETFHAKKAALIASFDEANENLSSFFGKFQKPTTRDLIVSMPVFRALDYPFNKFDSLV